MNILHFTVFIAFRFFKIQTKGFWKSYKLISTIFPTSFVCLCLAWFFQYFKLFHYYICYDDLWSVVIDVTITTVLGYHELSPQSISNSIDMCCVFQLLQWLAIPLSLSCSSGLSTSWDTTTLKLGQLIKLQWPPSAQVKEEPHNYSWWRCCEDCYNDNKGFRVLHKLSWWSSNRVWNWL